MARKERSKYTITVTHKMSDLGRKRGENSGCSTKGGETRIIGCERFFPRRFFPTAFPIETRRMMYPTTL